MGRYCFQRLEISPKKPDQSILTKYWCKRLIAIPGDKEMCSVQTQGVKVLSNWPASSLSTTVRQIFLGENVTAGDEGWKETTNEEVYSVPVSGVHFSCILCFRINSTSLGTSTAITTFILYHLFQHYQFNLAKDSYIITSLFKTEIKTGQYHI